MMGFRNLSVSALILWILLSLSLNTSLVSSDTYEDAIQDEIDDMARDLTDKYSSIEPDDFWHPYVYGTGNENREIIHVQKVNKTSIPGYYFQWKYARLGLKHFLVGLSRDSIDLFGSDFKKIASTSTDSLESFEALAVYTRWNDEHNHAELIILAVTSEPRLNVYQLEGKNIENVGSFPLHYSVREIEFCHVGSSTKVIVIPKDENIDIDIYNVEASNSSQVWFFQRLPEAGTPNVVVYDSDMLESVIAVAGNNKVDIYTYDSKAGLYDVYQSVSIPNPCRRLFSFTLAYQHYIGCVPVDSASSVRFISYNYNTNEYSLEENTFGNITAAEVYPVAVADYRDEYLLVVQDHGGLTHIMSYHGIQVGFAVEYSCTNDEGCPVLVDLRRGIGFRYNEHTAYVFPGAESTQQSEVLLILKEVRDSISPLLDQTRNQYNTFYELSKRFADWDRGVIGVQARLKTRVRQDRPNIITGDWEVETLSGPHVNFEYQSYNATYNSNSINEAFKTFKFVDVLWTEDDFSTDTTILTKELSNFNSNVKDATAQLNDAVVVNSEYVQHVKAPQEVSGMFQTKNLVATAAVVPYIVDSRRTEEFLNSLAVNSKILRIKGSLSFNEPITVNELHTSEINEIYVSDIARLSQENVFECALQFYNNLTVNGSISAKSINGINLLEEIVTPYDISGFQFLDGIVVRNDTKTYGSYDFATVLLRSSAQVVSSHVYFPNVQVPSNVKVNLIDGYDFTEFSSSVITSGFSGKIKGTKTVTSAVDTGFLNLTNFWNYLPFPDGFVYNSQKNVILNSKKDFAYVNATKVSISGLLDGYDPNSFVSLSTPMVLSKKWSFKGPASIVNDITVAGLVDGVSMKDLLLDGTLDKYRDSYIANADVEFENEVIFDGLSIKSEINGKYFDEAFGHLLLFNGSQCNVPGLTTILTNLALDNIIVDSGFVNSLSLEGFFGLTGDQNITGHLQLSKKCQFSSLYAFKYDTIPLHNLLTNAVRLTGLNNIPWKTHFEFIKCGSSMIVYDPINYIADYGKTVAVTSGREYQTFLSPISFQKIVLDNLVIEDELILDEGKNLAGMNVVFWDTNRLRLSRDEQIDFRFEVEGLTKAYNDIYTSEINDIPLWYISNSTFRTDSPNQIFTEYVSADYGVKVNGGTIYFEKEVSGYSLDDIAKYAFPLNSSENGYLQLQGNWHFQSIRISRNLTVNGNTCGVDLSALESDSVREGESNIVIRGYKTFNNIEVKKDITAESINENMASDDLFTLHDEQSINCHFHFYKDVTVDGKLITNGYLNDVLIQSLIEAYSHQHDNVHTIHGDYASDYNITTDLLNVEGDIKDYDFLEYLKSCIRIGDTYLKFSAKKTFSKPVTIDDDSQVNLYNNIELLNLQTLLLQNDHIFGYPVVFKGQVEVDTLEVSRGDVSSSQLADVDWESLLYAISKDGHSNPSHLKNVRFDNVLIENVISVKTFQGHPFEDYIKLNEEQDIDSLRIKKAKFHGPDVPVDGLVSGVNLPHEYEETLMSNTEYLPTIGGNKTFQGSIIIKEDFECFGTKFKDNIVDITKDFVISSPIEFEKPVYIDGDVNVTEPVHGHTIDSIISEALTQDNDQPITGEWEFVGGVTFKEDVRGPGELENFNIQGLIDRKNIEIKAAEQRILKQKQIYQQACYSVYNATEEFLSNPMKLDAFDKHQSIILRNQVEKAITISAAGKLYLLTASSSCEIVKYEWKLSTELFYKEYEASEKQLHLGHVRDWYTAVQDDNGLLVFSTQSSACSSLSSGIHFVRLEPSGIFSRTLTLLTEEIKTFKVINVPEARTTAVIVINRANQLKFLAWDESQLTFVLENEITLSSAYDKLEITPYRNGIGILVCSENEVAVFYYDWNIQVLSLIGKEDFLTGRGSLLLFENYDNLYALVPKRSTHLSTLQASCTMQIFQTSDAGIHQFQQMDLQDLVSASVIDLSYQKYISFLSKTFGLSIYKFMGLNGLERLNLNPIKIFNGYLVRSFDVTPFSYNSNRPFLLVLTTKTIEVYHSNVHGDSMNFNSKNLCRVN